MCGVVNPGATFIGRIGCFGLINPAAAVAGDTLDPAATSVLLTLSNGNLTATRSATSSGTEAKAISLRSHSSGKKHFEITVDSRIGTSETLGFGIASASFDLADDATFLGGSGTLGLGFWPAGAGLGRWYFGGGVLVATSIQAVSGDVLAFEFDFDSSLAWVKNVTQATDWNGTVGADPATGTGGADMSTLTGGPWFIAIDFETPATAMTLNAGSSTFALTPSTGFTAW